MDLLNLFLSIRDARTGLVIRLANYRNTIEVQGSRSNLFRVRSNFATRPISFLPDEMLLLLLLLRQVKINKVTIRGTDSLKLNRSIEILYSISKRKDIIFQRSIFNSWPLSRSRCMCNKRNIKLRLWNNFSIDRNLEPDQSWFSKNSKFLDRLSRFPGKWYSVRDACKKDGSIPRRWCATVK